MAKTKSKMSGALAAQKKKVVMDWERYIGRGELEDWQRLMHDLGFDEEFPSKSQCRKALKSVWVNIVDFLRAVEHGLPVHHFDSERELAEYSRAKKKIYPKNCIPKDSPLRRLLAQVFKQGKKGRGGDQLTAMMGGLSIAGDW